MTAFIGRIDSIFSRQFTAALETTAAAGATVLTVVDGGDLDEAGQLTTPWDGEVYDYTFDGDVTVTLAAPLASAADEGETLVVWDVAKAAPVVETIAHVVPLGDGVTEDVVEARVSYPLIPLLGEGIRDEDNAEAVTVREDSDAYVVAEVLGQVASLTDEFVTDVLVPQLPPLGVEPDGLEPAANPDVTLRPGIGALFVVWELVDNADPVTYDVYAVPAADVARLAFPPLDTDKVGEVLEGTAAQIRALPDGTDLSPEGSYAIAVYARDADGTCPTDAVPVIGAPAKVNSEDLALNALTVDHLTGNDALFQALKAEDIEGVTITGSVIEASEFRTNTTGNYWRLSSLGDYSRLQAVPSFGEEYMTGAVPSVMNQSIGTPTEQIAATALLSGAFAGSTPEAGVIALAYRNRATTADPWVPESRDVWVRGDAVEIYGGLLGGAGNILLDAKNNEGTVGIHATHIDISTYTYGGDSVNVSTGVLTLSGDEGVAINGPTATLNGAPIAVTAVPAGRLVGQGGTSGTLTSGTWTNASASLSDSGTGARLSGGMLADAGLKVPRAGWYQVSGTLAFNVSSGNTGRRGIGLDHSSSTGGAFQNRWYSLVVGSSTSALTISHAIPLYCEAGDYIRLWGYTDVTGVTLNLNPATCQLAAVFMSD